MCILDDEIIEDLCSLNFVNELKDDKDDTKEEKSDIIFGEEDDEEDSDITYDKLGTTQAYRFQGMTLITSPNPISFAVTTFNPLLEKLKENGIDSSSKIIEKYNKEMSTFNKSMEKLRDNLTKQETSSKNLQKVINSNINDFKNNYANQRRDVMDVVDKKLNKMQNSGKININEKASMQLQQMEQTKKPNINMPNWSQINTFEHIKYFSKSHLQRINPRLIRSHYPVEDLPLDCNVPDEVMLLLMCGVGIYSPTNDKLDYNYTRFVLDMASSGLLAYLVADASISYGTNYPIVRLFVTDDFAKQHSILTLLQLMGRPGRVGLSYKAEVFLGPYAADLLLKFSHDAGHYSGLIEANNINKTVQLLIETINKKEQEKRKKLEDELKFIQEQKILAELKRIELQKIMDQKRKEEEQRKLELQHKKERENRLNGFSISRDQTKADIDNSWRKRSIDNRPISQQQNQSNVYVAPFQKKSNDSEWQVVDKKKSFMGRNRWN